MSTILTFDQGNSSTKLVGYDSRSGEETCGAILRGASAMSTLKRTIESLSIDAAVGCSVSGGNLAALLELTGAPIQLELTPATAVPLRNRYGTPATLGADRLAAAVGAASLRPSEDLLVADIGTACTYDFVSASGEFLGGNIACGPGMRLRALHHYTARLPLVSGHFKNIPRYGTTTEEAMRSGAMQGVVAELMLYSGFGRNRRLMLSGGWAPEIAALLPPDVTYEIYPHLVNFGLYQILIHNYPSLQVKTNEESFA